MLIIYILLILIHWAEMNEFLKELNTNLLENDFFYFGT